METVVQNVHKEILGSTATFSEELVLPKLSEAMRLQIENSEMNANSPNVTAGGCVTYGGCTGQCTK